MGAAREGFDLFHKYGRRHFVQNLRRGHYRQVRQYVFRDTCAKWICWLSGGHEFTWQPDLTETPIETFCHWCHTRKQ